MNRRHTRRTPGLLLTVLSLLAIGLVGHASIRLISRQPGVQTGPEQLAQAIGPDLAAVRTSPKPDHDKTVLQIVSRREKPSPEQLRAPTDALDPLDDLFRAMRVVESVDSPSAVGDGGRSRGPYQISRLYWKDATRFGGVRWSYIDGVWHERECRQVMLWYWQRYVPAALAEVRRTGSLRAMEILARTHNGGPMGPDKPATLRYWRRIRRRLPRATAPQSR